MSETGARHETPAGKTGRKEHLRRELREYAVVAAYLYVCFAALAVYRIGILREEGQHLLLHGVALGKALVLGKFLLLGEAFGLGAWVQARTVLRTIVVKVVLAFLLLVALSVLEEVLLGWVHGRTLAQTLAGYEQHAAVTMLAQCLLLFLVLVPLLAAVEIGRTLGPGVLKATLLGPGRRDAR